MAEHEVDAATLPISPLIEPKPRAVTIRAVLLGLIGVVIICGLVPYNDYALENTFLIGNFLPIGVLLLILSLVLIVNAPLRRFMPRFALREAELATVLGMMLVGCAVPSSGLMRYLPASIVGLFTSSATRPDYAAVIAAAHVPDWLLPTHTGATPADIGNSDTFKYFATRAPDGHVPYAAWLRPMLVWGAFIGLLYGLLISMSVIVRRQWVENERLAFPLATVYHSLIEAPAPGRALNELFSSRGFWIAASVVFAVHGLNSLSEYIPAFPEIPLGYNFFSMLADDPWRFMSYGVKSADISFCMVGLAFFLQSKTAFSLFFFYLANQVVLMILGTQQVTMTEPMQQDQTFGGLLVLCGMLIYVGRQHWWMVIRHMFGRRRGDEFESRYLPYAFAGWAMVACFAGVVAWLMLVGMSMVAAILITLLVVMTLMLVARVVAETGLIFVQFNFIAARPFQYSVLMPSEPIRMSMPNYFFSGWFSELFYDVRECLPAFFMQSLRVADDSSYERSRRWRTSVPFIFAIALALVAAYFTSFTSMLKVEYTYASTLAAQPHTPLNQNAIEYSPQHQVLERSVSYTGSSIRESHNALFHVGLGAAVVGTCSILRLTVAWWPLNPIGFVLMYAYAMEKGWFSLMLGWLAKVIIVRLGGASLLKKSKPIFIGLVMGEAVAAAFWLIVGLVLNATGHSYKAILFLPGMLWH